MYISDDEDVIGPRTDHESSRLTTAVKSPTRRWQAYVELNHNVVIHATGAMVSSEAAVLETDRVGVPPFDLLNRQLQRKHQVRCGFAQNEFANGR